MWRSLTQSLLIWLTECLSFDVNELLYLALCLSRCGIREIQVRDGFSYKPLCLHAIVDTNWLSNIKSFSCKMSEFIQTVSLDEIDCRNCVICLIAVININETVKRAVSKYFSYRRRKRRLLWNVEEKHTSIFRWRETVCCRQQYAALIVVRVPSGNTIKCCHFPWGSVPTCRYCTCVSFIVVTCVGFSSGLPLCTSHNETHALHTCKYDSKKFFVISHVFMELTSFLSDPKHTDSTHW